MNINKQILILAIYVFTFSACTPLPNQTQNTAAQSNETESNQIIKEVSTDVCSQFTQDFVSSAIGKSITKTESQSGGGSYNCQYYVDETHFISLTLSNLSVENQKKGALALDRKVETSEMIKMEHFLTIQEDGNTNAIYLVLGPNQFIRVDRSSTKLIDNQALLNLAIAVSEKI